MSDLHVLLKAGRRRLRWVQFIVFSRRFAIPITLGLLFGALIARYHILFPSATWLILLLPILIVFSHTMWRSIPLVSIARKIDSSHGLHDDFSHALEFTQGPPYTDPVAQNLRNLAQERWRHQEHRINFKQAIPLRITRPHKFEWGLLAAIFFVTALGGTPSVLHPFFVAKARLEHRATISLAKEVDTLQQLSELSDDRNIVDLAMALLKDYERGFVSDEIALRQLHELLTQAKDVNEQATFEDEDDLTTLQEGLLHFEDEIKRSHLSQPDKDALLGERSSDIDPTAEIAEVLRAAIKGMSQNNEQSRQTAASIEETERRLRHEKERQTRPNPDENSLQRMKNLQRKLERLRRSQRQQNSTRQKVEQLQQEVTQMAKGAAQTRSQKMKSIQRKLQDLRKKDAQARRRKRLEQVLETARNRISRSQAKDTNNQAQMERFLTRASGEPDQAQDNASDVTPDPSHKSGSIEASETAQMQGEELAEMNSDSEAPGSGSAAPQGKATATPVHTKDTRVEAQHGKGVTRAEVIATSAQQGFASADYVEMYSDYRRFAQTGMDREPLPSGIQATVLRYFDLIAPRTTTRRVSSDGQGAGASQ